MPSSEAEGALAWIDGANGNPHRLARAAVTLLVSLVAGMLTVRWFREAATPPDFWFPYAAARALSAGANPYLLPLNSPQWPVAVPSFFPLPAAVLVWPLATLELPAAGGIFVGASAGALAWCVTRHGLLRALLFLSGSFLMAARFGQWAPALCVAALVPGAGWLAAAKPTIGVAMLAANPSRRGVLTAVAFGMACLLVLPTWPLDWMRTLRGGGAVGLHMTPVLTSWGWPLLLTALRWRRPEARLLLALACVPQMPMFYDQLALAFVARTRVEAAGFTALNFGCWVLWLNALPNWTPAGQAAALPYFVLGTYAPALALVMLKPNVGEPPRSCWRRAPRIPPTAASDAT